MIEIRTAPHSPKLQELISNWESAVAERNIVVAENAEDALRKLSSEIGSMSDDSLRKLMSVAQPSEYAGNCALAGEIFRELCFRAELPVPAMLEETIILLPK